jgi:hypothetical protein
MTIDKCAPHISFDGQSCISLELLVKMADAYNESSSNKIKLYPEMNTLNPGKYKKYLLEQFESKLSNKCSDQKCWTEQSFIEKIHQDAKEDLEKYTFRPNGPGGRFEWLNTMNIDDVMEQYEKKYPEFKYLGTVPMDFDDLPSLGIKNLNLNNLIKESKTKLGIVFNLDNHDQPGSHWVAMFSDLKDGKIYYFDSVGIAPEPRVRKLMRRIAKFCQTGMGIRKVDADYNRTRHQYKDSECGVYSMNFIHNMLEGKSFKDHNKSRISDDEINKYRNVYFSNVKV